MTPAQFVGGRLERSRFLGISSASGASSSLLGTEMMCLTNSSNLARGSRLAASASASALACAAAACSSAALAAAAAASAMMRAFVRHLLHVRRTDRQRSLWAVVVPSQRRRQTYKRSASPESRAGGSMSSVSAGYSRPERPTSLASWTAASNHFT